MSSILQSTRNVAFAAAITVGLGFAATQAFGSTLDPAGLLVPCESEPGTCPVPISDCNQWCVELDYDHGYCHEEPQWCCVCFHR